MARGVMKTIGKQRQGFTLVELSLSIAFIAILSLTMIFLINDTVGSYRRGITLNQINTTGMDLVDDIRMAVQSSPSRVIGSECATVYNGATSALRQACVSDNDGQKFIVTTGRGTVTRKTGDIVGSNMPLYGAFCTGEYSYIWNSGYVLNSNEYTITGENSAGVSFSYNGNRFNGFKLLKVQDSARAVCIAAAGGYRTVNKSYADFSGGEIDVTGHVNMNEDPVELLTGNNLALYDLSVAKPAGGGTTNDLFYAVSFVLGTLQGGINVLSKGNFCATPEGYSTTENFDYCAINKFNFAAQAIGG